MHQYLPRLVGLIDNTELLELQVANGKRILTGGTVLIKVSFGTAELEHKCHVLPNLPCQMLVGCDLLRKVDINIRFGGQTCSVVINDEVLEVEESTNNFNPIHLTIGQEDSRNELKNDGELEVEEPTNNFNPIEVPPPTIQDVTGYMLNVTMKSGLCFDMIRHNEYDFISLDMDVSPAVEPYAYVKDVLKLMTFPNMLKAYIEKIAEQYPSVFNIQGQTMGNCKKFEYRLLTKEHHPIMSAPYRFSEREHQIIEEQLDEMLKVKAIRPSTSPYRNPIFVILKKDGKGRFILDARRLNAVLIKDQFPLPHIRDILDELRNAKVFSHIDLLSGYWQVPLYEGDRVKTAFATRQGLYEFCVMPFGLATAPASFQRMMQDVLQPVFHKGALVYLDDLILYSNDQASHIILLDTVIALLDKANLRVKPGKCSFFQSSLMVLGHVISADGISADPEKIESIVNYIAPTNVTQLQRFLGSTNYYHSFIPKYATIAHPLYALLRKDSPWRWDLECEEAFSILKRRLTEAPILVQPDFYLPFVIVTDASHEGLGGYLAQSQSFTGGNSPNQSLPNDLKVIAYCSRTLQGSERNYAATELEALGILNALNKFRVYILGHEVHVFCDHSALVHILRNPHPASTRLARFIYRVMCFDPQIHYIRGVNNHLADALSRNRLSPREPSVAMTSFCGPSTFQSEPLKPTDPVASIFCLVWGEGNSREEFERMQTRDEDCAQIRREVKEPYHIVDNILMRRTSHLGTIINQLVIPKVLRKRIIRGYHDDLLGGHLGIQNTFKRIRNKYYWPGYYGEIQAYVLECEICQKTSRATGEKAPTYPMPIAGIFDRLGIDVVGPFPPTARGNRYIVVMVDHGTRWVEAFATSNTTATTIGDLIYANIICRYGPPKQLLSDRGANFLSRIVARLCDLFSIEKINTTAYHPQCNGLVERTNGTLIKLIRKLIVAKPQEWDGHLPAALFAYRTTPNATNRVSPYELIYGRSPRLPIDMFLEQNRETSRDGLSYEDFRDSLVQLREWARLMHEEDQTDIRAESMLFINPFKEGDRVWLYTPVLDHTLGRKFSLFWNGPHQVINIPGPVNCIIQSAEGKEQRVHISRLKTFLEHEQKPDTLPDDLRLVSEDEEQFEMGSEDDIMILEDSNPPPHDTISDDEISAALPNTKVKPNIVFNGIEYKEVDRLLGMKYKSKGKKNGKSKEIRHYLVKWKDPTEQDTWVPYHSLRRTSLIDEYQQRKMDEAEIVEHQDEDEL